MGASFRVSWGSTNATVCEYDANGKIESQPIAGSKSVIVSTAGRYGIRCSCGTQVVEYRPSFQ